MAVPTITSISPASGRTLGNTLLAIVGTNVALPPAPPVNGPSTGELLVTAEVLVGGLPATRVRVREDSSNPPDGTILQCLAPAHARGPVDVVVRNLDLSGQPVPGEEATLANGFTYEPIDLTDESDLTRLVRTLIRTLKDQVLENVSLTTHTDFDDETGGALNLAAVSELPALIITDVEFPENRFYSQNELGVQGAGGAAGVPFQVRNVPYTLDLTFTLIGISDHTVELLNLLNACTNFFHNNKLLFMECVAGDPAQGRMAFEMDYAPGGHFKVVSRQNNANVGHFTGAFVVRGLDVEPPAGVVVGEGVTIDEPTITTESTGETFSVGPSPGC